MDVFRWVGGVGWNTCATPPLGGSCQQNPISASRHSNSDHLSRNCGSGARHSRGGWLEGLCPVYPVWFNQTSSYMLLFWKLEESWMMSLWSSSLFACFKVEGHYNLPIYDIWYSLMLIWWLSIFWGIIERSLQSKNWMDISRLFVRKSLTFVPMWAAVGTAYPAHGARLSGPQES